MKRAFILVSILVIGFTNAQTDEELQGRVGINTTTPKASLDINSIEQDKAKGLLIPRITGDEIKAMTKNLTEEHNSLLVFATEKVTTVDEATERISEPMYYRFKYDKTTIPHTKTWIKWEPTGLERVVNSEGEIGYKLVDYDKIKFSEDFYEDENYSTETGAGSVDLSTTTKYSTNPTNSVAESSKRFTTALYSNIPNFGAVGKLSYNIGNYNKVINNSAFALGSGNIIKGEILEGGISIGYNNYTENGLVERGVVTSPDKSNFVFGSNNKVYGAGNMALGVGNTVYNGISLGNYSTNYSFIDYLTSSEPNVLEKLNTPRRIFVLGNSYSNGTDPQAEITRSDFLTILNHANLNLNYDEYEEKIPSILGVNIDNFEKTSSAAVVQINGKTLIGYFGDNDTNDNTIDQAPNSQALLNVLGSIKIGANKNTVITENTPCEEKGEITFYKDDFYGCKSSGWVKLNN